MSEYQDEQKGHFRFVPKSEICWTHPWAECRDSLHITRSQNQVGLHFASKVRGEAFRVLGNDSKIEG